MNIQSEEQTIDLMHIFKELIAHIVPIGAVTLIFAAVAFLYSSYMIKPVYTATTSIYVMNTQGNGEGIDVADITASQMLVKTYSVVLSSDVVMDDIGERLLDKYGADVLSKYFSIRTNADGGLYIPSKQLAAKMSLSGVDETEMLYIKATTPNPELSADMCNFLIDMASDAISDYVGSSYVNPVGKAKIPTSPSAPNAKKNGAAGAAAGFLISCFIVIVLDLLNNTVKDAETLTKQFGLPVLAEIPKFSLDDGGNESENI